MTFKNEQNIAIFSLVALLTLVPITTPEIFAEEDREYKMIGDVMPVLTFTFRDGVETHEFPVFEMGENFADNSGTSFSVEGSVEKSPMLHKALDEAYKYRFSNTAFDYQYRLFDVDADFVKSGESLLTIEYRNCYVDDYQIETLDSNDYESYFKEVGFAIVDKIDFVCSGANSSHEPLSLREISSFTDFGESGFNFASDMRTSVTLFFDNGVEKIEFPFFDLTGAYEESSDNVVAEFNVEGVLGYYPLLQHAVDKSRQVSSLSNAFNTDFDAMVEFTNGEEVVRGFEFRDCRISDAQITTKTDKEEGFIGKSGFVVVNQYGFTCSGFDGVNNNYDELRGDAPIWKTIHLSNEYVEPIQNTDKGLSAFATFTFPDGIETIEFSMFTQSNVLTVTEDTGDETTTDKATYPSFELRGIVGNYPMLYNYVDDNRKIQGVAGTQTRVLIDVDVDIVSNGETIRGFNYANCRAVDYVVETDPNNEESYVKNKIALENIFDFECQGYHPNNPVYDAMFAIQSATNVNSGDLRDTQDWRQGFYHE